MFCRIVVCSAVDPVAYRPDEGTTRGDIRHIFRVLDRLLNAAHRLVEFGDHALAQPARFADAVAAISQPVLTQLRHQHDSLGAPYVDGGNKIGVMIGHK